MNKKETYTPTIGLEIHAELKTASKMFCSCKNDPDEERPNVNVCPVCLGHPGALPVLNREAIKHVLKVGLSVGGKLADFTEWDRKNYFYPDIPKGYQISQYKYPLVSDGELSGVAIERIHLEEDTARSTHDSDKRSLIDFGRSGVPLMELVTKPVIHDAAVAVTFAKELQLLLRYLGAGEANMEKGEMRVEANVSVSKNPKTGDEKLGTKTEVKNLNSFRAVERAIRYEIARQTSLLERGEQVVQETRGWDDARGETFSQRSKESSHDYRYFPDPDIPKLKLSEIPAFSPSLLKEEIPELPSEKRARFKSEFGMTEKEIAVLVESPDLAEYYESIIKAFKSDPKKVKLTTNYLLTDYIGILKTNKREFRSDSAISPLMFAELMTLVASGDISSRGAKDLLALIFNDPELAKGSKSVHALAEKHDLLQKSDSASLMPAIIKVISDNARVVAEYRAGKTASLQFLVGQAMKATKGSANPEMVSRLLKEKLAS